MTLSAKLAELHPRRFFGEAFAIADARRDEALKNGGYPAWQPFAVAAIGAVVLLALQKYGTSQYLLELVADWQRTDPSWREVHESAYLRELYGKVWWTSWRVAGYLGLPALCARREPPACSHSKAHTTSSPRSRWHPPWAGSI